MTNASVLVPGLAAEVASPLFLEGWLEFQRRKWGVRAERIRFTGDQGEFPCVEAVYFLNRRGRIVRPPRSPYLPVAFRPGVQGPYQTGRESLVLAEKLAGDMRDRRLANAMTLAPEVTDARPWQWAGLKVGVRYTFFVDFPHSSLDASHSVRRNLKLAGKAGYTCARCSNMADVFACIHETESRKGFDLRLAATDLNLARELMGDDHLRAYVCYAPSGEPVSARALLFAPGVRAIDWIAGTTSGFPTGSSELLLEYVLGDLQSAGASGLDFGGANIPSVAAAKARWGSRLVPFYTVDTWWRESLRDLAGAARAMARPQRP